MCGPAEPFHHGAHWEHGENLLKCFVDSVFSVVIKYVVHSFSHSLPQEEAFYGRGGMVTVIV